MPLASTDVQRYRFRGFELDGDSLGLTRGGEEIALRPKAARVLRLLVTNAGRLVTREEIRDQVWGADTNVDFDHSLHTAIRQVRAALGESGEHADLIQTYPRRGYRFEAEVELVELRTGAHALESPIADTPRANWLGPWHLLGLAVVAAVFLGGAYAAVRTESPVASPGPERISVAPFRALSEGAQAIAFAEGLDAELTGALNTLTDEGFAILTQVVGIRPEQRQEAARAQAADLMLSGAVQVVGEDVRVTVQLLRLSDGEQVWADSFSGTLGEDLALQEAIAREVVAGVAGHTHGARP